MHSGTTPWHCPGQGAHGLPTFDPCLMVEGSLVPPRAVLVSKGWCSTVSVHLVLGVGGGPGRRCPQRALDTRGMPGHQGQIDFQSPGTPWLRPNSIFIVHVNDDRSWMGGDPNLTLAS